MNKNNGFGRKILSVLLMSCMGIASVFADDAEIFSASAPQVSPNLLFLLDMSGSMSSELTDANGVVKTRVQVMQEVLADVLQTAPDNLNIGLMHYGANSTDLAGGVDFPVKPIDAEALPVISAFLATDNLPNPVAGQPVREFLVDIANSWVPGGYTPIVDSLYEAAMYFRGGTVTAGALAPSDLRAAHPSTYAGNFNVDNCGSLTTPFSCNNSAGECIGTIVAGSCQLQWVNTGCASYGTTNTECCGGWVGDTTDESGNFTNWSCPGGFTCAGIDWSTCLVPGADVEAEICQQQFCSTTVTGGASYNTPIEKGCQPSYLVFMSDGEPNYQGGHETLPPRQADIEALTGTTCANAPSGFKSGTCGEELTHWLATTDQNPSLPGDQFVKTFTIGFALDDNNATSYLQSLATAGDDLLAAGNREELEKGLKHVLARVSGQARKFSSQVVYADDRSALILADGHNRLQQADTSLVEALGLWKAFIADRHLATALVNALMPTARAGLLPSLAVTTTSGGGFFAANDLQGLTEAFQSVLNQVNSVASSFASPSYKVDPGSLLAHADEVFIPVFEASGTAEWVGNLKKFKLQNGQIVGQNGNPAVDEKGAFIDGAWDYWGAAASGADVGSGGAASLLDPAARVLYTDNASTSGVAGSLVPLGTGASKSLLGNASMSDAAQADLIKFARGYAADGTARQHMGDIMNSKPVLVSYADGKSYVFTGSNEGYLHAFDAESGKEVWAYMPSALLKNLSVLQQNGAVDTHVYGVDGALTVWHDDTNNDGRIIAADGDKSYLFFGLRRGGSEYYALDITTINDPQLVWHLGRDVVGFNTLGESWSRPVRAKMRLADASAATGSVLTDVLVLGGGYDPVLEESDLSLRAPLSYGNDVFIVDARTGSLIWSLRRDLGNAAAALTASVPGDIRVLDMDRNGALDRLYFTDTSANVWRVDMDVDVSDADTSTLYDYHKARLSKFAELGGDAAASRMFYYEPDVALVDINGKSLLTLAVGSGYRSHPLGKSSSDRFYVLVDRDPFAEPDATRFPLREDASLVSLDLLSADRTLLSDDTLNGWYYALPNQGEKVLAPAVTFLNKIIFTSFSPDGVSGADECASPSNVARAYVLDIFSGLPVADLDPDNTDPKDRSVIAGVNEILDAAQIVFRQPHAADGSACTTGDCHQGIEIRVGKTLLMDESMANNASPNPAERLDIGNRLPRSFWLDRNAAGHN